MFVAVQAAIPYLEKTQGCIVNISSIGGMRPANFMMSYCVTKACASYALSGPGAMAIMLLHASVQTSLTCKLYQGADQCLCCMLLPFSPGRAAERQMGRWHLLRSSQLARLGLLLQAPT